MNIIWITDPHLDFLEPDQVDVFLQETAQRAGDDVVIITGDIDIAHTLGETLGLIREILPRVFFVLGNHDAYGCSIAGARQIAAHFPGYLTVQTDPVALSPRTCLIGHDGWADGRAGDYASSSVMLNDYIHIEELAGLEDDERLLQLNALGDEATDWVREMLPRALAGWEHVILATHVPPFQEACWHEGCSADDNWAPHFSCYAMGQALMEIMAHHRAGYLTVLCGHTHSPGVYQPAANIMVYTGGATYGKPAIHSVFPVDNVE